MTMALCHISETCQTFENRKHNILKANKIIKVKLFQGKSYNAMTIHQTATAVETYIKTRIMV